MIRALLLALVAACCGMPAHAGDAGGSGGGFPALGLIMTDQSACPSGWTELTTYQGRYLAAKAATGSAGDTLGSAIATTTTDSSGPTYSVTGTNLVTTAGTVPAATAISGTTLAAGANTITPPATQRSSLAPNVSLRLCKRT